MHPILKKMNLKEQNPLLVLNAPDSFQEVMDAARETHSLHTSPETTSYPFVLIFAEDQKTLSQSLKTVEPVLDEGDVLLWFAYPKKSSKKYKSDINRDAECWQKVGDLGFEPVRQVAIDANWSALRFRRATFIKTMKRQKLRAMSEEGKRKVNKEN